MTRRLAVVTGWLLAGQAVWLALFWALLQVPESSVAMLALSALLVVGLVVLAAAIVSGGMAAWDLDRPAARGLLPRPGRLGAALLSGAVLTAVWWTGGLLLESHGRLAGQIDAVYIAWTGSSATAWIHTAIVWAVAWLRWSLGLSLAVSLLGAAVRHGGAALGDLRWVRAALSPRVWGLLTVWLVCLVVLPWSQVHWRPSGLSLVAEPWFVGAKLAIIAIAMGVGSALILRIGFTAHAPAVPAGR